MWSYSYCNSLLFEQLWLVSRKVLLVLRQAIIRVIRPACTQARFHIYIYRREFSRQLVLSIYYQRFRKGFDSSLIRYMQKIQALWNCKKLITFSVPKTKLLVVLDYDKRRPSLCLQEEKNSVRLLRVEPVCIIFTFTIKQGRHILEEGVKALALAMVVHWML